MRVVLITQGLSRVVVPLVGADTGIIAIIDSAPRGYKKHKNLYRILNAIKNAGAALGLMRKTLRIFCKENSIPYRFVAEFDAETMVWLKDKNPDLIVVYSMSQLLKRDLISIPKHGVINLHPSFLPDYRGPNPDFWQYYDVVAEQGVTVHFIDEGEDTGPILAQKKIHVPLGMKSPERMDLLIQEGAKLLCDAIFSIKDGSAVAIAQPKNSPTSRARNLRPEEHASLINWNEWPIERVWHVLRGTELWLKALPPAYRWLPGQYWHVDSYEIGTANPVAPGEIYYESDQFFVACSDGRIALTRKFNLKKMLVGALR